MVEQGARLPEYSSVRRLHRSDLGSDQISALDNLAAIIAECLQLAEV